MKIGSYPKVLSLGHRYIADIFLDPVVVEEKVDGSQISFGVIDGSLEMRSKGAELFANDGNKMFYKAVESISNAAPKIQPGWIYRGEYLQSPRHNTLSYERTPINNIVIFDIEAGFNNHLSYDDKVKESERVGYEVVPGKVVNIKNIDDIKDNLDVYSFLGKEKIEGLVFKNYNRITPDGKFMVGKYVREEFKERHAGQWKTDNPSGKDVIQSIICDLKTEARYLKAMQHLKDSGMYTGTPSDIGSFLKLIHKDIDDEDRDYISDMLLKKFLPDIKRGVCGGAPQWYKDKVAKLHFEDSQ